MAKEFRLFKGGRFVNRPYGQILNCINRSRRIKKHCSRDVEAPSPTDISTHQHTECAAILLCLIVGATIGRPFKTISNPFYERHLVGQGLVSRRFDSMKSVCNGGTKAPPYNAPLTHLRWELPPRGAFRKKLRIGEKLNLHKRAMAIALNRPGSDKVSAPYRRVDAALFFACRDRRPRRSGKQQILLFKRLLVCSHTQSKRFFFSGRRGRRPLQGLMEIE